MKRRCIKSLVAWCTRKNRSSCNGKCESGPQLPDHYGDFLGHFICNHILLDGRTCSALVSGLSVASTREINSLKHLFTPLCFCESVFFKWRLLEYLVFCSCDLLIPFCSFSACFDETTRCNIVRSCFKVSHVFPPLHLSFDKIVGVLKSCDYSYFWFY